MKDCMDITSPKGTKVRFSYPKNGYDSDQATAKKHLTVGQVYTVDHTVVHDWHTEVFLQEKPGVSFNHVHFAKA